MLPFEEELPFEESILPFEEDLSAEQVINREKEAQLKGTIGALEAAGGVLLSLPGYVGGGLTGLGALLTGQGIDAAAAQQKYVQENLDKFLGAQPKTQEGKQYSEALGQAFKYPIEKAAEVGESIAGSEGRLFAGVIAETLLNFMPLHAGKKALSKETKIDLTERPKEPNQVLQNLDKPVETPITPEELSIDSQTIRGQQFGGKNALGAEFPELRGESRLPFELLPEDQYPTPDGGVRHLDPTTGKVVQGMDESVPTIDFPLRQEVLQQPEIKSAIDNFRLEADRLRQAGDEAGLARLESEFMSGMRQLGIYSPQDAIGLQKLWESVSRGDIPAPRYPEGIRKGGELNPQKTETQIPPVVDEASKEFYNFAKKPFVPKRERGAIDPQIFKEGFKRLTRALSRLTDQKWLKERFPSDKWMTNSDGTPLVLLHGTNSVFNKFVDTPEGVHAGFTVPAHLIRTGATGPVLANKPNTYRKRLLPDSEFPKNIHPLVIKRGNYPFLESDAGHWHPSSLMSRPLDGPLTFKYKGERFILFDLLNKLAAENGKPPLTQSRYDWYKRSIFDLDHVRTSDVSTERNRLFSQLLKEVGVDGFFYRNAGETLFGKKRFEKPIVQDPISFVTWNLDNIRSIYDPPKRIVVPAKQRGALNLDLLGVGKLAEKIRGKFSGELAKEEHKTSAFEKLPISKDLKDALIPEDISVEKVKQEALKVSDTAPGSAFIGGTHMLAEIKNHPVVYATVQWFNNATKRANYLIRENISPTRELLNDILHNKDHAEILHGIFMKELKQDQKFSKEQLLAAGVPDNVVRAYEGLRNAFDLAHKVQNETLIALGRKPLTYREAYISSRWGGDWRTPVYDKKGKLIWYIAEPSKKRAEAALQYLAENHPDLDLSKSKVEYRGGSGRDRGGLLEAGYQELLKLLDPNDPRVETLKSIYEDFVSAESIKTLGQTKHFEPKSGVRGFTGDRPWEKADIKDMFRQQIKYLENALTWAEMQKATAKAKQIFSDPELMEKASNAITLGKEVAKNKLGFGELKVATEIENTIAKTFGVSRLTLAKATGYSKMLFYWKTLGLNLPFTVVSLIQPMYTIPWHVRLSNHGIKHDPVRTFVAGMQDSLGLILEHEGMQLPKDGMTEIGRKAATYGIDNGIIDITTISDVSDLGRPEKLQTLEQVVTFNMVYSERIARAVAYMNFVHHLDQSGAFKGREVEMFQRAEELTNLSMADYRVQERAPIFNKLGVVGSALSTLNQFKINQLNQLYLFAKEAKQTGQYGPLLSLVAIQMMMGGAVGFFGINTLDKSWEYLKTLLPDNLWMKVKDFSIKESLIKAAFDDPSKSWLVYGGASTASGLNIHTRYDSGTVVDPTLEGLLPFIGELTTQLEKMWALAVDPESKVKQAQLIHQTLPAGLKGLYEANSDVFFDKNSGVATQVSDPLQGVYRRSPSDITARKFGFTGLKEAEAKELKFRNAKSEAQRKERLRSTTEKLKEAVIFGSPENVGDLFSRYVELNGTVPDLEKMFGEAFVRRMTTKLEQMQMKAKTGAGAKRYEDYVR
jgi:hypothetical protein